MKNNTDYTFPKGWGLYTDEQKCIWFEKQRLLRQAKRQRRAGMWDQWDEERIKGETRRE